MSEVALKALEAAHREGVAFAIEREGRERRGPIGARGGEEPPCFEAC